MTARGKEHWQAVRRAFEADAGAREDDAAAMTAEERVMLGLRMGASAPRTPAIEAELDRLALAQGELHARYRRIQAKRAGRAG